MRRISYAQSVLGTDDRVADLLLEYATLLARTESADTVIVPCRIGKGAVEQVSMLVGPASQITVWNDDEPFDADASDAIADLERRIAAVRHGERSGTEPRAPLPDDTIGPGAIDEFDDLA